MPEKKTDGADSDPDNGIIAAKLMHVGKCGATDASDGSERCRLGNERQIPQHESGGIGTP